MRWRELCPEQSQGDETEVWSFGLASSLCHSLGFKSFQKHVVHAAFLDPALIGAYSAVTNWRR